MQKLLENIQIKVNDHTYYKDPWSSDLGQRILQEGIKLIDENGLEDFTFKKLADKLDTTETSIYRYFQNKHKFLIYVISWYWGWQEYRLVFATINLQDPKQRLKKALKTLIEDIGDDESHPVVDLEALARIVISESSKVYLVKEVDEANRQGCYEAYKRLIERFCLIASDLNDDYQHPKSLISTIIEGILHQKFFALHMPSLSDATSQEDLVKFYLDLALNTLRKK